jgi:hypothetical protein
MNKKELETLALRKADEGKPWKEIVRELTNKEVDANTAATIAKQATRRYAWYVIEIYLGGLSLLMITAGGILLFAFFTAGKFMIITICLMVVGLILLLISLSGSGFYEYE